MDYITAWRAHQEVLDRPGIRQLQTSVAVLPTEVWCAPISSYESKHDFEKRMEKCWIARDDQNLIKSIGTAPLFAGGIVGTIAFFITRLGMFVGQIHETLTQINTATPYTPFRVLFPILAATSAMQVSIIPASYLYVAHGKGPIAHQARSLLEISHPSHSALELHRKRLERE